MAAVAASLLLFACGMLLVLQIESTLPYPLDVSLGGSLVAASGGAANAAYDTAVYSFSSNLRAAESHVATIATLTRLSVSVSSSAPSPSLTLKSAP